MRTAAMAWRICLLSFLTATTESAAGKTAQPHTTTKTSGKAAAGIHPADSGLTPREIFKRSISDTSGDILFLARLFQLFFQFLYRPYPDCGFSSHETLLVNHF